MPILYRDGRVRIETHPALRALERRAADEAALGCPDTAVALMIDVAELESAVVDALCPDRDTIAPAIEALRAASCEAARLWLGAREGQPAGSQALCSMLRRIQADTLPRHVRVSVSEGFAFYALFPETYLVSARRMLAEVRASNICTIGLRNIGSCLAAVVSAACRASGCRSRSFTVRPRAHPFARELCVDRPLADALRGEADGGACFAVVDEGPGISGSSFAAAVNALADLGVPRDRIFLFPSWLPSSDALSSSSARATWRSLRKFWTPAQDVGCTAPSAFGVTSNVVDFSAGAWRRTIFSDAASWPDVQPQHERVKWYVPSEGRLLKFVGLGRYGTAALARAHALADAGMAVRPSGLRSGFIDLPFTDGVPLARCEDDDTADAVGSYLGRIAAAFPARAPSDIAALAEMVDLNTRELLDEAPPRPPAEVLEDIGAAEIDGRMLAHEWIRTPDRRLAKVDGLDHHRDHFFPGVQSPAWDLAGAIVELRMNGRHAAVLLDRYEKISGDRTARTQLPYFHLAYAVFRAGYCTMANLPSERYSQCALNAIACFKASSKSPRKQIARSSMNT